MAAARYRLRAVREAFATNLRCRDLRRVQLAFGAAWTSEWALTVGLGIVAFRDGGAGAVASSPCFAWHPARLKQPISPVLGDRTAFALARGFQPAAPLTHPSAPALRARNELTGIELDRHRALVVSRRLRSIVAFARQALLGLAQRPAPALARA